MQRPTTSDLLDMRYAEHFADLARLCRALGAGADADDVAQEVLVYAREHGGQLRDADRVEGWLRTIAVRRTWRLRSRPKIAQLPDEIVFAPADQDARLDVAAALRRLPERERAALALVYGLGYSQEDAAEALGVRRGTIAATLFHARAKLATWLRDYERSGDR